MLPTSSILIGHLDHTGSKPMIDENVDASMHAWSRRIGTFGSRCARSLYSPIQEPSQAEARSVRLNGDWPRTVYLKYLSQFEL